jgi:Fic family protein
VLSERQTKVLRRLLGDFHGNLTTKKWAALAKCSVPTAQRDINDLIEKRVLRAGEGGSKNTAYRLA